MPPGKCEGKNHLRAPESGYQQNASADSQQRNKAIWPFLTLGHESVRVVLAFTPRVLDFQLRLME
jgi:hypothetical protein